ncbi:uncharacterized protein LOC103704460 isoform X2 [Phoenix dactylifera]|uniref:Uncharacterized protein LOC103704460 isoform X2 n=1 Tax=Phoenix dactylifera TaxID=42345 RepID=A0A8B8ZIY8_PHODC|nr:uncharacterized protein LOC103704460 isoform X2 [Phoenix dactylifera]
MDSKFRRRTRTATTSTALRRAAAAHHPQLYVGPSYSFLPNPNLNPKPILAHDNSASSVDPGAFRVPRGDPSAAHGDGYDGYLAHPTPISKRLWRRRRLVWIRRLTIYGDGRGEAQGFSVRHYGAVRKAVSTKKTFENLDTKKQKLILGGVAADSAVVCMVCNVVCNSKRVLLHFL